MICVIQRVLDAAVDVDGETVGQIESGLLVLAAVEAGDAADDVKWTANKLATLRIFRCCEKHFHIEVQQAGGAILLVSNFTVAAMTCTGRRPSFDSAMAPGDAGPMFASLIEAVRATGVRVEAGRFGADMIIRSRNDGPTTFLLESRNRLP